MSSVHEEIRDTVRRALGSELVHDAASSWSSLARLGAFLAHVPEENGGLGLGVEGAGLICIEAGRSLVPGPVMTQFGVIDTLLSLPADERRDAFLTQALDGEIIAVPLAPYDGRHARYTCVPDADRATHLLSIDEDGLRILSLEGARLEHRRTWDESRRLFDVTLAADAATSHAVLRDTADMRDRLAIHIHLALAGDSIGGAERVLAITIDYLSQREQFGRPLAMFQALKHRVADMKVALAAAQALYWSRASSSTDPVSIAALKALATTTYCSIAEEAIQLHGGIGLTMEHDCHRFLKRAMLNAQLAGSSSVWEEAAGRRLLAA